MGSCFQAGCWLGHIYRSASDVMPPRLAALFFPPLFARYKTPRPRPEGQERANLSAHQWRPLPRAVPSSCQLVAAANWFVGPAPALARAIRRPIRYREGDGVLSMRRGPACGLIAPGSGSLRRHPRLGPLRGNLLYGGSPPGGAFGRAISRPVRRGERAASVTGRPFRSLGILRRRLAVSLPRSQTAAVRGSCQSDRREKGTYLSMTQDSAWGQLCCGLSGCPKQLFICERSRGFVSSASGQSAFA